LAYAERGAYSDGIISLQKSLSLNQFDQHIRADLGRVLARAGEREAAIEILNEFRKSDETQYVSPVNMAKIHVGLGDHEEVIRQLEIAVATRAVKLPWFISDPCLAPVWADPRFSDLVKRIGLPQISRSRKL
jgi:tetratricopeptide (TPR) repeat protein